MVRTRADTNTNRIEVARGESPLGAWRLYSSSGPEGNCVDLELPDRNPPGGGRAFYSDCSADAETPINPATIADEHGALVYGLAPAGSAAVQVRRAGAPDLTAMLRSPLADGAPRPFVVATRDGHVDGTIRALAPDGRSLAAEPVP